MEIIIVLLLIAINGLFAMSEIAVVSSRRVRLEHAAQRGSKGARAALALLSSPTRFLSTVQIGITLIAVGLGAIGEALVADDLKAVLARNEFLAPYASAIATLTVVLAIGYLSLVIGELAPKRLALHAPEAIAAFVAPAMHVLSRITAPAVHFLSTSTDLLIRLFGVRQPSEPTVTEEDIRSMIRQGAAAGVFLEKERELVDRIFRLGDQRVSALMVPRADIVWLEADAPAERIRVAVATSSHSHFPVCQNGLDNLKGVVHLKDMIKSGLLTDKVDLKVLARKPMYVPESMFVLRLLEEFRRSQTHIAFILDEYGVVTGLITLNDIVEGLLGQIARFGEHTEPLAVQREDGSWLIDGSMPVQDLKELMGVDELPHEDRAEFNTIAGFIMTALGRVPRTGERYAFDRFTFEVVDMDRHRIDKVLLTIQQQR